MQTLLLPIYGWRHKKAGSKYPETERSFRSTTCATRHTDRGFTLRVEDRQRKIVFSFDAAQVDAKRHRAWLDAIRKSVGLGEINPQPYWGFDDVMYKAGTKLKNAFFVLAATKRENTATGRSEFFHYNEAYALSSFSFARFLERIRCGDVFVDFDARTGHDHGTKFRVRRNLLPEFYERCERIV